MFLSSFTGFYRVYFFDFLVFKKFLIDTGVDWVFFTFISVAFTRFNRVLPSYGGDYWVLLSCCRFWLAGLARYRVISGYYLVLPGYPGSFRASAVVFFIFW